MKNKLNKTNKLLTITILSFIFLTNINALEVGTKIKVDKDDGVWVVKKVNEVTDKTLDYCNIDNPSNPNRLHIVSKEFPTIGYTYENTCKSGGYQTFCTISQASTKYDLEPYRPSGSLAYEDNSSNITHFVEGNGGNADKYVTDTTASAGVIPDPPISNSGETGQGANLNNINSNVKLLSSITLNKNTQDDYVTNLLKDNLKDYSIIRTESSNAEFSSSWTNGYYAAESANFEKKGYFVSHYLGCFGAKTITCEWTVKVPYNCIYPCTVKGKSTTCSGTCYYDKTEREKVTGTRLTKYDYPSASNITPGLASVENFIKEIPEPTCSKGHKVGPTTNDAYCTLPYYRTHICSTKFVCNEVGPTKVEVYGYKLTINDKEAYCVTPAAGFNKSYFWDNRFDASRCKNSLQMYNKDGSTSYNIDCGYAYIMAEGKRLNAEMGSEVFSYGAISTAMKLFGTGIVGNKDAEGNQLYLSDLLKDAVSNKKFLQAAGYYTTYYGWGYGEYVGVPWVRGDGINRSSWPGIYRNFMPTFYSIFIHTAEVAGGYLKKNIRFADVGNIKDANGKYITDPFYYLNPKECKETFKNCTTTKTKVEYNDPLSQGIVNSYFPRNDELMNWLESDGKSTSCKDSSGLGVLCGLKNEKGNAEYIKAIYLYMRALQGNEIVYEKKIEDSINEYKPVDGLTKFLYEVDENGEASTVVRYAIDTNVTSESSEKEVEVDCDWSNPETKDYCKAKVFVFDANGNQIYETDHYDYCKKNYCYVKIKASMICKENQESSKLTSVVVTEPNIKSTVIKKIVSGIKSEQTIFVYDDESKITGGFCQEIEAVKENLSVKCPCKPSENPNVVVPSGNIKAKNYCSKSYNEFDQLYYGDPSMSTIINACYEEDQLKYDYTEDLNINGNDIVYDAELESKYSFQVKSDDFKVCKLYCRDESRFYIANKLSVKSGQNLKYDVGQTLIDKKIINETAKDKGVTDNNKQNIYNYMPSVVLQLRECTSQIDYNRWEKLYKAAKTEKEKNQLLYSIYNCNLYTTEDIKEKISKNKLPDIIGEKTGKYVGNSKYAESAMIEYKYNTSDGTISIVNDYGTTKDYLLMQEGCTSLGLNQTDCASYFLNHYSDDYYNSLGINIDFEHGLVDSNLNETIYCSGNSCYKLKGNDGKYYYNPYGAKLNDYTTQDDTFDGSGNIKTHESGKILNYDEWGLKYQDYDKNSDKYKNKTINGIEVPTNEFASFVVVTETGFYNKKQYYADSYSGIISTDKTNKNVALDKNILPLHLNKKTGSYEIQHTYTNTKTAYKRSKYYTEKNYSLFDKLNQKPGEFKYICTYDIYNTTTEYETDNSKRGLGFTYRVVNLNDVFESVTNNTREYPENWATQFSQNTLAQIQSSASNILEPDNNSNDVDSYLEYSYTLTPEGIKRIREYNKSKNTDNGYLDESLYDCLYDEEEKIFYNCKSTFLTNELNDLNGKFTGLIKINKGDGVSEFCSSKENENEDFCKYQYK